VQLIEMRVATIRKRYGLNKSQLEPAPPQPDDQLSLSD